MNLSLPFHIQYKVGSVVMKIYELTSLFCMHCGSQTVYRYDTHHVCIQCHQQWDARTYSVDQTATDYVYQEGHKYVE